MEEINKLKQVSEKEEGEKRKRREWWCKLFQLFVLMEF